MNGKIKKSVAIAAAAACVFTSLVACQGNNPYVEDAYQVVLDYNDEVSRPRTVYLEEGVSMPEPDEPLREGNQIEGWYTGKTDGMKVAFPFTPTESVTTLYAHWQAGEYSVTFDYNFDGSTPYVVSAPYNTEVDEPDRSSFPEYSGYRFYRWENSIGEPITFPYTVTRDAHFYASWTSNETGIFTVSFNGNFDGAPTYRSVDIVEGRNLTSRQVPSGIASARPGYVFLGWATEPNAKQPNVTIPYTPRGSVTLHAVWEVQTYLVRFRKNDFAGGNNDSDVIEESRVGMGAIVQQPADPARDGFIFDGWYDGPVVGSKVSFPLTIQSTTTLYAHWKSVAITTNTFDAEFVFINPNDYFPGYSGGNQGVQSIRKSSGEGATSQDYPIFGGKETEHIGHYVSAIHRPQGSISFVINSSVAVQNTTLYLSLKPDQNGNVFTPTGEYGYGVVVNGTSLNYGQFDMRGQTQFVEFAVRNVSLQAGENIITLITNNTHVTGTMGAMGVCVDYIRFDTGNRAVLTWQPEYDNLYRST